jgi:MauM/NapG family ferredoxin protein
MTWTFARRVRQASQIFFFTLAIFLAFTALRGRFALPLADIFFRFNPLSALASMLAARAWIPRLALALITVVITLLLGRVWCGWICPMGTLVDWVHFSSAAKREKNISPRWRAAKQALLVAILAAAVTGNLSLLVFDPLAIFTRSLGTVVIPALDRAISGIETFFYPVSFLSPLIDAIETTLRGPVLPVARAAFSGSVFIALLLAGILALNLLADRFWCRYLCPLGGLLGLLSRFAILRPVVGASCRACGKCKRVCPVGAIHAEKEYEIIPSECVMCLDCLAACPQSDIGLRPVLPPRPSKLEGTSGISLSRREVLGSMAIAAAGVLVAETSVHAKNPDGMLIRPPGAQDEAAFLSRCLRCSECIRTCPTTGLQPALTEAGLAGLWTPHLVSRLGACDYACTTCGQVCPSGAIPLLTQAKKQETIVGVAAVDRNRCLPWSYDTQCIVCEEMCPRPSKAIRLETVKIKDKTGREITLQRPYVLRDECIGCGICENHCPLKGEAAIRVYRKV